MTKTLLKVEDLTMHYGTRAGDVKAVDNVSFELDEGDSLGLVGESGCGKTSIALTLLRLLPENSKILNGHIWLRDTDLLALTEDEMRKYRWSQISMVFQAAMNSLNPIRIPCRSASPSVVTLADAPIGVPLPPRQAPSESAHQSTRPSPGSACAACWSAGRSASSR